MGPIPVLLVFTSHLSDGLFVCLFVCVSVGLAAEWIPIKCGGKMGNEPRKSLHYGSKVEPFFFLI